MTEFLYPLATVVLDFFCVLFCIRLSVTRRGPVWLVPMVLSLVLLLGSAVCLIATASNIAGETLTRVASYMSLFLFAVTIVWLITIIAFATKTKPDRLQANAKKAFNEDKYLRKRTKEVRVKVDRRPTAQTSVRKVESTRKSLEVTRKAMAQDQDAYYNGPVATVRAKKTSFSR